MEFFSPEAKLITAIGVCFLLFVLVTTGIRKFFAALGIEKEISFRVYNATTGELHSQGVKRKTAFVAVGVAVVGFAFLLQADPRFMQLLFLVPLSIVIYKIAQRKKQALQAESKNEEQGKVDA